MSGFTAINKESYKEDEAVPPLTADDAAAMAASALEETAATANSALNLDLNPIAEESPTTVAPTSTTPTRSDTEPSQATIASKGKGVLADRKPSTKRRVRYSEVKEFKKLELCYENNEAVPDDLEAIIDRINHRVGHEMKPAYEKMMMELRMRRWRAIEAKQADIVATKNELEQEVLALREERKRLQEELADTKYNLAIARSNAASAPPTSTTTPTKSKRSAKKAEPSITRPENATRRDTSVPMASVAVVAPFDTIIEAGVEAVVSGQRQRLEDWVKVAVGRDRPHYQ
ncbi:hypothetical protein EPUS_09482 [Endocarpon pusillum Z07020]|uniref:Uncharacterized protein n=1 Tax=Endocarpon pusillum (strain Z07020 / HMAS-L-300199) TaxID=1263415 RepID=U1GSA9_ENDPU|nr:uncharacterized protein EPUS_09482 [Endocarpon pusillum Z07020]ERF74881.1 hypothetical protein EPUS_09482 [Endocarpon pusillum Z07020]